MLDILYVAGTIAFFALMVVYVRACERLGAERQSREETPR
jgi:hypothetical protein